MNIQSGNAMGVSVTEMGSFRGTVLHEIGHALSLQHEHQSPEASCDTEFDWDTVYPEFKQRYGWDRAKVDHNLGTLVKSKRLRTTAYDPHSIMHYYFPAWMFRDGEASACYTGHNHTLSPLDIASIKSAYPQDPGAQLQLVNGRLEATKSLIEESISDDEDFRDEVKRAIQDVVKDNFPQADISIISGDSIATGDKSPVINRTSTEGGDIKIDIK
ncbi:M12 family metallopeptidase [Mesorhizobium sp. BHbsci]